MELRYSFLNSWPVVLAIFLGLIALFGAPGYYIASRRFKQPLARFLVRYGVSFLCLMGLEMGILWLVPSVHRAMQQLTAASVGWTLTRAGVDTSVSGSLITTNNPTVAYTIDVACLGGVLFWAYLALVMAEFKATLRQRLLGVAAGTVVLVCFNLFRITISVYVDWRTGVYVHDYFYLFNMAFVLLLWAVWLRTLKPRAAVPVRTM